MKRANRNEWKSLPCSIWVIINNGVKLLIKQTYEKTHPRESSVHKGDC